MNQVEQLGNSMVKVTLEISPEQFEKAMEIAEIYLYEDNGQRNLEMTVSANDINKSGKRSSKK